jgi:hypothetical protein
MWQFFKQVQLFSIVVNRYHSNTKEVLTMDITKMWVQELIHQAHKHMLMFFTKHPMD